MRKRPSRSRLKKLPQAFYLRPTVEVARSLLGMILVREYDGKRLAGKIVETEAYCEGDPASHSYRGRTHRNEVMFWRGGHLYVYFTYGMHYCANVVTGEEGIGEAVLIRAVEPVDGVEWMRANRRACIRQGRDIAGSVRSRPATAGGDTNLTNGPAKLCEAFRIGREENGTDLLGSEIYLLEGEEIPAKRIGRSRRIGITNGREEEWRFFVKGNPWVSTSL